MKKRTASCVAITLWITLGVAAGEPMDFKLTAKDGDTIDVKVDKVRALFDITSSTGIGHADIERRKTEWPSVVVIRLRLKGLEHFQVVAGSKKLEAAAAVRNGQLEVRAWKDGDESRPLDDKSPHWPKVTVVDRGQPAKTIPLADGWFDIELPRTLFEGNPPTIGVSWIDFYRN
jgi:hypothetical protein